jgi:hypothetical protein
MGMETRIAGLLLLVVVAAGCGAAKAGTAAAPVRATGDLSGDSSCAPLPVTQTYWIHEDGSRANAQGPHEALVTVFGGGATSITPGPDFDPRTATAQAIDTFGLGPAPRTAAERESWDSRWRNFKGFKSSGMCRTGISNR